MPTKQLSQLHDSGSMISYHQFEEKILNQKNNPIKTSLILTTQTQQLFTIYKNTKKIIGERKILVPILKCQLQSGWCTLCFDLVGYSSDDWLHWYHILAMTTISLPETTSCCTNVHLLWVSISYQSITIYNL